MEGAVFGIFRLLPIPIDIEMGDISIPAHPIISSPFLLLQTSSSAGPCLPVRVVLFFLPYFFRNSDICVDKSKLYWLGLSLLAPAPLFPFQKDSVKNLAATSMSLSFPWLGAMVVWGGLVLIFPDEIKLSKNLPTPSIAGENPCIGNIRVKSTNDLISIFFCRTESTRMILVWYCVGELFRHFEWTYYVLVDYRYLLKNMTIVFIISFPWKRSDKFCENDEEK